MLRCDTQLQRARAGSCTRTPTSVTSHREVFVSRGLSHHSSRAIQPARTKIRVRLVLGAIAPVVLIEREQSMKLLAASAVALGLSLFAMTASQGMPLAPSDQPAVNDGITLVHGGCGPGGHRGPYGGCRPLYNCPPGWHTGPYGRHCFRRW